MKRTLTTLLVLLALALATALGWRWIARSAPDPPRVEIPPEVPIPVAFQRVERSAPERRLLAQGRLEERGRATLACEEGGRIVWVDPAWHPGARVEAGQVLWRVEDTEWGLQESQLDARLETLAVRGRTARWSQERFGKLAALERERLGILEAEETRWRGLIERGEGTPSALDQARALTLGSRGALLEAEQGIEGAELDAEQVAAQVAEAQTERDRLAWRRSRLEGRAPMAGWLDALAPAVGQWVLPGSSLGEVLSDRPPRVVFEVGSSQLALLEIGLDVSVVWPTAAGERRAGRLVGIGTRVTPSTGEVSCEAELLEDPPTWRPGLAVPVELTVRPFAEGLYLAAEYVLWQAGRPGCFVAQEEQGVLRARWCPLELGPEQLGMFAVHKGLEAGQLLLTEPLQRLFDGARIVEMPH
ncbi:MAG: HlyD family efflux transporter periplasmic adaptor subunit [Planctomycetes bacterium]|nr:HlyD family efflux transporter periplasmic adaptor subunit [Planctomycetota bacterium]MCB9913020.1 HlyD family efflux transporter periplasmic adaptor subunit [Planctomycetota bacterium]HPF12680.1 HlyD family efflux transporter periplasmic adaptor subunit [Planctomycetota bacterium]